MPNRILFVCHEASRTGAPIVLMQIVEFAKSKGDTIYIVIANPYHLELADDFSRLGKVIRGWECNNDEYPDEIDLIYSNTITNGQFVNSLPYDNVPIITHVHELTNSIKLFGKRNLDSVITQTDLFVACSSSVRNHLVNNFGVPSARVSTIPAFVDVDKILSKAEGECELEVNTGFLANDKFVILGSGWASFRKGTDLFIKLVEYLPEKIDGRSVELVWVGGNESAFKDYVEDRYLERIHFTGSLSDPCPIYKRADVLALTSREDPFPLVMLECLIMGKPVIGFSGSGGIDDLMTEDVAVGVAPLNLEAMAAEIALIGSVAGLREKLCAHGKEYVREYCSTLICLPLIHKACCDAEIRTEYCSNGVRQGSPVWGDISSLANSGVVAVYYGKTERQCKKISYSRDMGAHGELSVLATDHLRFDPDLVPGLFEFRTLKIVLESTGEILFDLADQRNMDCLVCKGTALLLNESRFLTILSYGSDPQIDFSFKRDFDDDEYLKIDFSFIYDSTSSRYCKGLEEYGVFG